MVYGIAAAVILVGAAGAWGGRRHLRRRPSPAPVSVHEVPDPTPFVSEAFAVSATDLGKAIVQRADLMLLDVRGPESYAQSDVQGKGAVHTSGEAIVQTCIGVNADHPIVIYCDSPHESVSRAAAQRLIAAGYSRVAVLIGGFGAWLAASLPLERTPLTRGRLILPSPRVPDRLAPFPEATVNMTAGIQGAGPYFNGQVQTLSTTHACLASPRPLPVGQTVRLTLFSPGEPMDIPGRVLSCVPARHDESTNIAEIAFDALKEEQALALEGIVLAQRTARSA